MIQTISTSNVTSFGGIHLIHQKVRDKNITDFIYGQLGQRAANSKYSYADLILSRCYTALCGGECAEDIDYLKDTFQHLKGLQAASPDTILNMEQELSTPVDETTSGSGTTNKVNINEKMNSFLLKMAVYLNVLTPSQKDYCLDFDHQFIPTEKHDATYSYKHKKGYFPAVASIDNTPVYIENRNGNCSVKFNQLETLKRVFAQLDDNGIHPARCRMDCGSYIKEVCDWLSSEQSSCRFYIRAENSHQLITKAAENKHWQDIQIAEQHYQTSSIEYRFGQHTHRVVCYRQPNKTGQSSVESGDSYNYHFIITNDRQWADKQIIEYYNGRGNSERLFDIQNNDFNWKRMPASFLEYNTVYLTIMAACHVLYKWLIDNFSKACSVVRNKDRLKKFIFRLVSIPAKVTHSGRRQVVKLFTNLPIHRLGDRSP